MVFRRPTPTGDEIVYTSSADGISWSSPQQVFPSIGFGMSLAVSSSGQIAVAAKSAQTVVYAQRSSTGTWVTETAAVNSTPNQFLGRVRVLFDGLGVPHIVYGTYGGAGSFNYLTRAGGSWSTPQFINVGTEFEFALGSDNVPHVCFWVGPTSQTDIGRLYWSRRVNGSWAREQLTAAAAPGVASTDCQIAGDSSTASIAFTEPSNPGPTNVLRLSTRTNGTWSSAIIQNTDWVHWVLHPSGPGPRSIFSMLSDGSTRLVTVGGGSFEVSPTSTSVPVAAIDPQQRKVFLIQRQGELRLGRTCGP